MTTQKYREALKLAQAQWEEIAFNIDTATFWLREAAIKIKKLEMQPDALEAIITSLDYAKQSAITCAKNTAIALAHKGTEQELELKFIRDHNEMNRGSNEQAN